VSTPGPAGRLRIAFALDSLEVGGTELNAVRTLERLDRTRFEPSLVLHSNRGPLAERVRDAGVPIHVFPLRGFASRQGLVSAIALTRHLARERVDVLHAHDIYSNIFSVPCARLARVPLVIASRRWWQEANRAAYLHLNRVTYRMAHRVLANAQSVGELLAAEGVPRDRIVVLPNFVEPEAFTPPDEYVLEGWRARAGVASGDLVIGVVANLHPVKNHLLLIEALPAVLQRHPATRLVFVGEGAERERIQARAVELGVSDRVSLVGRQPPRPSWHWLFDVSVLCSRSEGFPNSVVEAMAAGRPLIATRVGGVPDVAQDGVTARLIPSEDVGALAEAIVALLGNPAERVRLGGAGARRAAEHYHADHVIAQLAALYESSRGARLR
jgi:glycosyltransferase involved in cell wall biosynthesis